MGAPKIKVPDFYEAGLSYSELEQLATEIHDTVLGGSSVSLPEYIEIAKNISPLELGVRKANALKYEPKLNVYFPDEVLKILKTKADERKFHRFNASDDKYIERNQAKGSVWLAARFYVDHRTILRRAEAIGVKLPSYFHQYTESEDTFILNNMHHGPTWLSKELSLSVSSVFNRIHVLRSQTKFEKHNYTSDDEEFIKKNFNVGYKKLAEHIGVSTASVRSKVMQMRSRKIFNENS